MNRLFFTAVAAALCLSNASFASTYNDPGNDAQYTQCITYAMKKFEGGGEKSKIKGQTNAQAWCTCLWNETPDDFKGNLVTFSESSKGTSINKLCERYSGWSD